MTIWKQFRVPLLALTFSSVVLALGNVVLFPIKDKRTNTPFVFPEKVSLPQWQFSMSRLLAKPTKEHTELFAQKHYRYLRNDLFLDIEMRYLTDGDGERLFREYTSISSSANVRQREGVGYYGLGVSKQRAYLSACINSQGSSTFTLKQFNQNQYFSDLHPQRLLSWLLGQESLKDKRCLWAHLSIPLKSSSPEAAYQVLETAWFSWYQWWQPRFPKH
ncbi:cyanoexosortase A system-associated protein [Mastigocladopsis repens]|uniref:cyanoexosortase A system-associated protein n=1 Tax=Mastigocladopsis repens TaxID=221287 RepID=UPI000306AB75|nr:cyanoexosortase A system-associated protein [Mastigocladopsis repens]